MAESVPWEGLPHLTWEGATGMDDRSRDVTPYVAEGGQAMARSFSFLARVSRLLADSLDYETTLRTVAGLALPYLGAWSIVDVVEGEIDGEFQMRRLAVVHPDPKEQEIARRLEKSWPPEAEDPIGAPVVLRKHEPQVVSRVTDEMLQKAARSEENLRDLRRMGIGSFLVVPLTVRERVLGAITFISPAEHEVYTDEHLELAEDLAARCALAIDNARHYRDAQRARKVAEESTRAERDARYYAEAIVDTVREPLLVLDYDLRVQTANRSFYQTFRATPEQTEGRFIYDIGDGNWESPRLRTLLEEILPRNAELEDFEVEEDFGALGRRTMLLNARRIHRGRERTPLILLAIEDVTERKRANEERERLLTREREAKEQAEQAVSAREQILGIVSHDLRSPLNVISASAQLLQMLPSDARKEKEEDRLQAIIRSAERMNRLIGDLLDVSRIEVGRFSVERAPVDVAALLKEACAEFRTRAGEASLEFECEGEESLQSLPKVSADRDRIFQVLENLVGNAIKFTPEGGQIILRVEPRDEDVVFSVSDTGPGIAEEDLEHLFDPYWRSKEAAEAGAGLGLSISRGIVQAHGGRIWAESEVGKGSTFHFTIPVAETESRGASPDTIPQAP